MSFREVFYPDPAQVRASGGDLPGTFVARLLGKSYTLVDFRRPPMWRGSGIIGFGGLRSGSGRFPCWRTSRPTPRKFAGVVRMLLRHDQLAGVGRMPLRHDQLAGVGRQPLRQDILVEICMIGD